MQLTAQQLIDSCRDDALDSGITIRAELEPVAGRFAPVKPAVYAGGVFQIDRRWEEQSGEPRQVDVIVIDNVPSQANRLEAALEGLRPRLGLPEMVLDLSEIGELPPHLPPRLSGFRFPHRQADAYLRDSLLEGEVFGKSAVGSNVLAATADAPLALLEYFPQALLYGFWQSHLGKKRSQAKLARSWVSEIVGFDPAAGDVRRNGLKGDPLNLAVEDRVEHDKTMSRVGPSNRERRRGAGREIRNPSRRSGTVRSR